MVVPTLEEAVGLANELDSAVYPFVGSGAAEAFWKARNVASIPGRHAWITGETGSGRSLLARTIHHFAGSSKMVEHDCIEGMLGNYAETTILRNAGTFTSADWKKAPLDEGYRIIAVSTEPAPVGMGDWFEAIRVPPLRERLTDLSAYVEVFLQRKLRRQNVPQLEPEVLRVFCAYPWPGNLTELENIVERTLRAAQQRKSDGELKLRLDDLPELFRASLGVQTARGVVAAEGLLSRVISRAMQHCRWDRKLAADRLGLSVQTLESGLRDLGLDREVSENGDILPRKEGQRKLRQPK